MGVSFNGDTPPQKNEHFNRKTHGCWGNPPFWETPYKWGISWPGVTVTLISPQRWFNHPELSTQNPGFFLRPGDYTTHAVM